MSIKARQHNVILVQDMYPTSPSSLNASIPGTRQTSVLRFGVERHAPRTNSANNFGRGIVVRAIVDDLDLHDVRAGILRQHTVQRLMQKSRAMKRRNHYRPERPMRAFLEDGL